MKDARDGMPLADLATKHQLSDASKKLLETTDAQTIKNKHLLASQNGLAGSLKNLGEGFKLAAKNIGVMLVVTIALKAAYAIFDRLNVTMAEQQEVVDGLTSKLDDLNQKYEALSGRKNLSDEEQKQLEYLKSSIAYNEKLLQQEQERLAMKQLYGDGDIFSNGELSALTTAGSVSQYSIADKYANEVNATLNKLKKEHATAEKTAEYIESLDDPKYNTANVYAEESKEIDKLVAKREKMIAQRDEWVQSRNLLQQWKDSGYLNGEELVRVEADLEAYDEAIASITNTIHSVTIYVDVVPEVSDGDVNTEQDLKNQFGSNIIGLLSEEELAYAKKITNISDYGKNITLLKEDITELMSVVKDAEIEITVSDSLSNLEKLKDTFNGLSEIYNDVKDGAEFDYGKLVDPDFAAKFSDYKAEYQSFVDTVAKSPKNITACQSAFDDLVTAWLMGQEPMQNITEESYDLTVAWLKQIGVANAAEMADYALTQAKVDAFVETNKLEQGTWEEIESLLNEAEAAGFTEQQLIALANALILADDNGLDFSQQIAALDTLAYKAGVAAGALGNLNVAKLKADPQVQRAAADRGMDIEDYIATSYGNSIVSAATTKPTADYKPKYTGSGGGGGSDPYKAEIDKFESLSRAVNEVQEKIDELNKAYEYTDDTDEQIALQNQLLVLYQEQKDALSALNNARDAEIASQVADLRSKGFNVDYNPETDYLYIKNKEHINDLAESNRQKVEEQIEKAEELNDANREAAQQWKELSYSILDVNKQLEELAKQRYENTVNDIETMIELLEGSEFGLDETILYYKELMTDAINEITRLVKKDFEGEKDRIKELMTQWMSYYDARIEREIELQEIKLEDNDAVLSAINNLFDEEIKKIDDEIEALSKSNEERKEALELQKAQAALDKAKSQKTRKVLRDGVGFVYEADEDAIKEAEETLADLRFEETISTLESQKEALEELQNKWAEIPELFEKYQNELLAEQKLGADWEKDILNDRKKVYEDFKNEYFNIQKDIYNLTEELNNKTNESYLQTMEVFKTMMNMYMDANKELDSATSNTARKYWYVGKDGKAPSQAQKGDIVYTKGGTYEITGKDENGKFTSKKINDASTTIPEGLWGKEIKTGTADLTDVIGMNVLTNQDIVESAEKHTDAILANIIGEENLSKFLKDNTSLTADQIESLLESIDYTDDNTDATGDNTDGLYSNTDALRDLIYALANLELEEELPQDPFADLDYDSMDSTDKQYIQQLKDAYQVAIKQGNTDAANHILSMIGAVEDGSYREIGEKALAMANGTYQKVGTTQIGGANADKAATDAYLSENKRLQEIAKSINPATGKSWGSDEYIERLEKAEAIVTHGSGMTVTNYQDENGRTSNISNATNQAELKMTADQIREQSKNTSGLIDNTGSNIYSGDASYDLADTVKEVGKETVEGVKDVMDNATVKVESTDSYSASGSSKKGGKVSSVEATNSKGQTVTVWGANKQTAEKMGYTNVKEKAKGGLNLKDDIYNIDEKGAELTIEPDQGRYVRIGMGGNVIPADVSKRLWDFGMNPPEYIKQAMAGTLRNLQSLHPIAAGTTVQENYNIAAIELPNVQDVNGFLRDIKNLPNLTKQYMTRK